jgi:hypothetical protein
VPAAVAPAGDAAELALGLLEGQLDDAVDAARALRRARLELDRPKEAARAAADLAQLTWKDLDPEERGYCPPLFLVTTDRAFRRNTLASLEALFETTLPIRVLLLTDSATEGSSSVLDRSAPWGAGGDPCRHAERALLFVQSSVAESTHLESAVADALAHDGAAVLRVLAPSPSRGRFASDATLDRARDPVTAGSFPLIPSPVGQAPPADPPSSAPDPFHAATPPDQIEALEQRHAAELAALRDELEARLAAERVRYRAETAQRVRGRLMRLALGSGGKRQDAGAPGKEARP